MLRNLRHLSGALILLAVALTVSMRPALAQTTQKATLEPILTSEEQIGPKIFQVSRVVVNAPPTQVQSVLTDYDHAPRIFDNVIKCKVVQDKGDTKLIAFTIKAMGNAWTFDYVLQVVEEPGRIEWHRASGSFKANEGFWKLEPLNGGTQTLVTYAKFVDGGMMLPRFIVNKQLRDSMPVVMSSLKVTAEHNSTVASGHIPILPR